MAKILQLSWRILSLILRENKVRKINTNKLRYVRPQKVFDNKDDESETWIFEVPSYQPTKSQVTPPLFDNINDARISIIWFHVDMVVVGIR